MWDWGSVWRGVRAWRPRAGEVNYAVRRVQPRAFWAVAWTPIWHEQRGPYISIGLGWLAFYRGY